MAGKEMIEVQMRLGRHHHIAAAMRGESGGNDVHQLGRIRRECFDLRARKEANVDPYDWSGRVLGG
jgi:hypothetical protein